MAGRAYLVSEIVCPVPLRVHREVDVVEAQLREWVGRFGFSGYDGARLGWLAAAGYPDGPVDRVALAADLLAWIVVADDRWVDEPDQVDSWLVARATVSAYRVAEDPDHPAGSDPLNRALRELTDRIRAVATPGQYQRFLAGLAELLMSQLAMHAAPDTIDPGDYLTVRRYSTGGGALFALIDVIAGVDAGDRVWQDPAVIRLARCASDIVGLTNDVYSCWKELERQLQAVNLPQALANARGVPLPEAAEQAAAHVRGLYDEFRQRVGQLPALPHLPTLVSGLESFLAGHHHWFGLTDRYETKEQPPVPDDLALTDYQAGIAEYWDATATGDPQNVRLGQVDGLYHHHYGLGEVDPALRDGGPDDAVIAELHRLESAQAAVLIDHLDMVGADDRVLDAGCGRGGTSFMAHQRFGCYVDGVTISRYQAEFAQQQAAQRGVADRVRFHRRNMLHTGFDAGSFEAVWTNETTMYVDLDELFSDFHRLLAPGGRYVCITGCHNDVWGDRLSPAVAAINERYDCRVHPRSRYFQALAHNGLLPLVVEDLTPRTLPYWQLRARSSIATGVEDHFLTAYREGSLQYLLIVADRP